ncbi:MAG TPA: serine hydrolase domain-containing protein [Solirubrobacterales bacterium]
MISLETIPIPPIPRLPLVPDPLRRIRVPRDIEAVSTRADEAADIEALGMTTTGVERIWAGVERLYRSGFYPAIALCVRRDGQVVLDRAIGHAYGNGPSDRQDAARTLATPETPFVIFSASKAMTAVVAHLLDERGLLHVDDRVCEYIPEYAAHGKEAITIGQVLSHRAGVPNLPPEAFDLDRFGDREFRLELLCAAKPRSRPGKLLSYHAVSGGFIIAEIVQRVTGRDIRAVLGQEILHPLGFRWGNYGVSPKDVERVAVSYPTGPPALPPLSTVLERALGLPPDEITVRSNDPRLLTGIVPSGNVVTTANELSRFFELLRTGGELDGVRILEPRTIRRAISERAFREIDFSLVAPLRHASGFMLGAKTVSLFGPDTEEAFGHLGFTNVLGWADPERALSVGLMTSGKPTAHPALADLWLLTRAIGQEAPKVERTGIWFTET